MTRYTDFGRKRTYLQAGFDDAVEPGPESTLAQETTGSQPSSIAAADSTTQPPPKKKRKRTKPSKRDGHAAEKAAAAATAAGEDTATVNVEKEEKNDTKDDEARAGPPTLSKKQKQKAREKAKKERIKRMKEFKSASEERRLKRIGDRKSGITCLACRKQGHLAKECPNSLPSSSTSTSTIPGKPLVGICYRCGSNRHTLARCKAPVDSTAPLPFASCFVCGGTGHLASGCAQNAAKGVYPNGGACKLCGETSHLARNCALRHADANARSQPILGTGCEAGADEDDFHSFKRKTAEVEREVKGEERARRLVDVKAGALTGTVKAFGKGAAPLPSKVVIF